SRRSGPRSPSRSAPCACHASATRRTPRRSPRDGQRPPPWPGRSRRPSLEGISPRIRATKRPRNADHVHRFEGVCPRLRSAIPWPAYTTGYEGDEHDVRPVAVRVRARKGGRERVIGARRDSRVVALEVVTGVAESYWKTQAGSASYPLSHSP